MTIQFADEHADYLIKLLKRDRKYIKNKYKLDMNEIVMSVLVADKRRDCPGKPK